MRMDDNAFQTELMHLRCDLAAEQMMMALWKLGRLINKAHFDPNQPRAPAGMPGGGRWTEVGKRTGGTGRTRPSTH